ncbi:MAG: FkbM family methyltransferase [Pseudomonadota bacterium]
MAKRQPALDTQSAFGSRKATFGEWLVWALADWRPLGPRLRRILRKRFARPVTGPFDVRHQGMALRLYPAENHCDRVIFGRQELPEQSEHDAIVPLIFSGMVFVDIGANVGSYSVFVGNHAAKNARLLAFEPHPRTHQKLLYNLAANGLATDDVLNCGVGEREEVLSLWSDGGSNIGHTSLLAEGTANAKVSVDVPVRPLLSVLEERGISRIDLMKVDIEGFEDRALAPFLKTAPDSLLPSHVLMEMEHQQLWQHDLVDLLHERGYAANAVTSLNTLFSR